MVLRASANNQSVETEPAKLTIPSIYVKDFYRDQVAAHWPGTRPGLQAACALLRSQPEAPQARAACAR